MSRSSHQRGFAPSFPFLSTSAINSFTIPRSYNHSSDESEAGSPSGGGGGNHGFVPAGHEASLNPNYNSQSPLEDTPYVPRGAQNTSTRGARELTLPPDSHQYEYNYGNPQLPAPTDVYAFRHTQHAQHYPGNASGGGPEYEQALRHAQQEGAHWGTAPRPEGYYRSHTSVGSGHNFTVGAPDPFQRDASSPPQQRSFGGPQSHPRSGPPSGRSSQSPESPPGSLNPGLLDNPYEDAGEYLRAQLNIPRNRTVDLYALPDPPDGGRPTQPLAILMKLAIYGSPQQKLTLREIYTALEDRFEWFRLNTHDQSWKNSIRHHLSLNKVFRNIQRPITEPGKGKYWVLNVAEGEGYKRERKRKSKTKTGSGSEGEPAFLEESEDFSEDDRSRSGSPGPSTSRQERARRARGSPYPQPSPQFTPQGPTSANFTHMSLSESSNPNTYSRIESPPAQFTFDQTQFYGYPAQSPRTQTHPSFAQPPSATMHPGSSRTQSAPMPGMIATSGVYNYPGGHVQSGPQQVFRGPLRQSPTERTPEYLGQIGGAPPGGYVDPRNTMSPYPPQYNQGQYDSNAGMGRGSRGGGGGRDRN